MTNPPPTNQPQPLDTAIERIRASAEYQECGALTTELVELERRKEYIRSRLDELWRKIPALPVPKYRICMRCSEYTLERFSARNHAGCTCCTPMCAKHSKAMDPVARGILAELVNGG